MTVMDQSRRHDESSALGNDSTWTSELSSSHSGHSEEHYLPIDPKKMPIVVYLASDFRPGPMDNGMISIRAGLLTAVWAGAPVVRWTTSGYSALDGIAERVDPRDPSIAPAPVDLEDMRHWAGGITLVASWPGNEDVVRALEIVLTGAYGEPNIVRDAANARLHMHERYAGYGSGIDYAIRKGRR